LPPSERDFAIYHAVQIAGSSTRSQADLHEISQTRVRQIVRRVVEWLGQVLPPQAKIAKEQEIHLARQIAADRFQFQLEEVTESWRATNEIKYASLRIRLTTAQARLGAVGGRLDGLAADAIEGLPVPVWSDTSAASQESKATADPVGWDKAASAADGPPPDLVTRVHPGNALTRSSSLVDPPETPANSTPDAELPTATTDTPAKKPMSHGRAVLYYKLQHILADTDPPTLADKVAEARRILRASGAILMDEFPNTDTTQSSSAHTDPLPEICSLTPASTHVAVSAPPPGDCSPVTDSSPSPEPTLGDDPSKKPSLTIPCNDSTCGERALRRRYKVPSRRLLASQNPQPVITIHLTPNQPAPFDLTPNSPTPLHTP
jgi:hypothetical protein